jgi:hypothetical protein
MRCRQVGSAARTSNIWIEIYRYLCSQSWFCLCTQQSGGNSLENVFWPDTVEALTHEHWEAIDTLSQGMRDKWKQAETSAIELEQFRGDNYNRALSMLADSGSLPPLLMDPFLQWLAKLAGLQYLDNDGIRLISDSVLQRAVAPEAVKTDFRKYLPGMHHTVILDPTNSTTLATKKMSSSAEDLS